MVNQINQGSNSQANVRLESTKQQATESANKQVQVNTATAKATSDSVSITPQAQQLKKLNEKAEQASGVDQKKVNELKKAIANGEYKIDAEKLAENINKLEFKLFGR
ncbi:flagellar biosynthesis anti-sigma factor FlgM [Pseudoalteromonas sp. SSM20]|jgi:negative regulator of flagellin synthesis FlgM|uniref:flagellar biosynthesis anti-sigma factor FlgM n=1 Tax=Pseudoalteromonas sp. SSM20 TaxID=3139394 RepID=UPI003BA9B9FD